MNIINNIIGLLGGYTEEEYTTVFETNECDRKRLIEANNIIADLQVNLVSTVKKLEVLQNKPYWSGKKTTKTIRINGKMMTLNNWVKNYNDFEYVHKWAIDNRYVCKSKDLIVLGKFVMMFLADRATYVAERKGVDKHNTPKQFIENNLKGDCDEQSKFIDVFFKVQLYLNGIYREYHNNIWLARGVVGNDSLQSEAHQYCVLDYNGKSFAMEGSWHTEDCISDFGRIGWKECRRYLQPVIMANDSEQREYILWN